MINLGFNTTLNSLEFSMNSCSLVIIPIQFKVTFYQYKENRENTPLSASGWNCFQLSQSRLNSWL